MTRSTTGIVWRVSPKAFRAWGAKNDNPGSDTSGSTGGNGNGSDNAGSDNQQSDDDAGDDDQRPDPKLEKKYSDADMAALRRKMEKEAKDKADKAKKDAEDAQALEQGKAKELAERYKARLDELEPTITRLQDVVNSFVDAQIKDWPASLKKLVPEEGDAVGRYEAYERSQEAAQELMASRNGQSQGDGLNRGNGKEGNRENPPAKKQTSTDDDNDDQAIRGSRVVLKSW